VPTTTTVLPLPPPPSPTTTNHKIYKAALFTEYPFLRHFFPKKSGRNHFKGLLTGKKLDSFSKFTKKEKQSY
jgi:hypothetical protein